MPIPDVVTALIDVFTEVADRAALDSGFVRRQSKLNGQTFVQALTFGWLHNPDATLDELSHTTTTLGVTITPQGLDKRFGPRSATCLRQVLQSAVGRVIAADPATTDILRRFPGGVCLLDSTVVRLPDALATHWRGCGGTEIGRASCR